MERIRIRRNGYSLYIRIPPEYAQTHNLKAGDVVTVKDRPTSRRLAIRNLELTQIQPIPDWLVVDKDQFQGKITRIPTREEIAPIVNEQLVVELYSR